MKLLFISLIVFLIGTETPKNATFKPLVVLELFTSQGCSSCPPADVLLDEVKKNYDGSEVIGVSFHVDYWNYIGWNDPFSNVEFSHLQRKYGSKFDNSTIYTPQMVINGKEHFVGSNQHTLISKIASYSIKNSQNSLLLSNANILGKSISFDYNVKGEINKKLLRILLVIDERTTTVSRGENKNKSLKNSNIVVQQSIISLNSATGKGVIEIPKIVNGSDKLVLIGFIETPDLDIVGGSQLNL